MKNDRTRELIYDAVDDAVEKGLTPREFVEEVLEAWMEARRDQMKSDIVTLNRMLETKP